MFVYIIFGDNYDKKTPYGSVPVEVIQNLKEWY
jgi:hypothetical protein